MLRSITVFSVHGVCVCVCVCVCVICSFKNNDWSHKIIFYFHFTLFYVLHYFCSRYCGYIVDNGDTQFQFHGFCCAPNSDKLCLALHSACQCRYQRVIDAHLTEGDQGNVDITVSMVIKYSNMYCLSFGIIIIIKSYSLKLV